MKSTVTKQIISALQQVVSAAVKDWLNENRAEIVRALHDSIAESLTALNMTRPGVKREPKFLDNSELAERWKLHPETIRSFVRQGRLPRMSIGRNILVPVTAVAECEKQGWVPGRS
jgi:signal transduction histidine kinase